MKQLIKGLLIISLSAILLTACRPSKAFASDLPKRYTTQTVNLLDKVKGRKVYRVPRNTKLRLIKEGNTWARVRYKGRALSVRKKYILNENSPKKYTGPQLKRAGAIIWRGRKYTYYTSRILPDPNNNLGVPGKWLDKEGFYRDKYGYIVLGSCTGNRGKIIATPFGKFGKVYDAGYCPSYLFDCYTNF